MVRRAGHAPVAVARGDWPEWIDLQTWAPDGHLLFLRGRDGQSGRLWRVRADAGVAEDVGQDFLRTPNTLSLSPDGRRLAYAERLITPELRATPLPPR